MKVLLGNGGGDAKRLLLESRSDLGNLLSPIGWRNFLTSLWACDNDGFVAWQNSLDLRKSPEERAIWADYWRPGGRGEERWRRMLLKLPADRPPGIVLLPDKVMDWQATLDRAWRYRADIGERTLRCAVALQDGCRFEDVLSLQPNVAFVGGSKAWKWQSLEAICRYFPERGIAVHVGRVSGTGGIRELLRLERHYGLKDLSCDGTGWVRHPSVELPRLIAALDRHQGVLDL